MNLSGADMQIQELSDRLAAVIAERDDYVAKFRDLEHELELERGQVVAATQRAETAESQLAATRSPGSTGVWMHMDKYQELPTAIERYGADQWRRGNAGKDPQEFEEWRREQP